MSDILHVVMKRVKIGGRNEKILQGTQHKNTRAHTVKVKKFHWRSTSYCSLWNLFTVLKSQDDQNGLIWSRILTRLYWLMFLINVLKTCHNHSHYFCLLSSDTSRCSFLLRSTTKPSISLSQLTLFVWTIKVSFCCWFKCDVYLNSSI